MKLALLGCDDEAVELIAAAHRGGEHQLVAAYDALGYEGRLKAISPQVRFDESWESLLAARDIQAVIVARAKAAPADSSLSAEERRCDQLRKLAQEGVPMLVVHPACEMIVAYEIEMIRAARGAVLLPYVPRLTHPAVGALQELAGPHQPLGEVEQVLFERQMSDRAREQVLLHFARDAALLTRLVGHVRQIAASGPAGSQYEDPLAPRPKSPPSLANLSVHVSGEGPFPARWSVAPAEARDGARLTLLAARGKAVLHIPDASDADWTLEHPGPPAGQEKFPPRAEILDVLDRLQMAIHEQHEPDFTWLDACRVLEATEAIDRSLEKGRAVPLYTEAVTEEQSFKGVMAVGGCLLLVVTLAGLLIAALVEGLGLEFRHSPYWKLWPLYLLTPVVAFLILQVLQIVAKGTGKRPRQP
jgi:hypothetical protein